MNETHQNDMSWLVIGAAAVLFILAFVLHSFLPILLIVPLVIFYMSRQKKPEQYYVPSSHDEQASTSRASRSDGVPKESPHWDMEQPQAQYPEQMPPM